MARTYLEVPYQCSEDAAKNKVEDYLAGKKFVRVTNKKGEEVWQLGKGLVTVISFMKVDYDNPQTLKLYAWIAGVGLGQRSALESNLKGVYAMHPKRQLKKMMREIEGMF